MAGGRSRSASFPQGRQDKPGDLGLGREDRARKGKVMRRPFAMPPELVEGRGIAEAPVVQQIKPSGYCRRRLAADWRFTGLSPCSPGYCEAPEMEPRMIGSRPTNARMVVPATLHPGLSPAPSTLAADSSARLMATLRWAPGLSPKKGILSDARTELRRNG
jgi:hypothetical protein